MPDPINQPEQNFASKGWVAVLVANQQPGFETRQQTSKDYPRDFYAFWLEWIYHS
jgi:hypothetical protein